jgi:hypothetical protein
MKYILAGRRSLISLVTLGLVFSLFGFAFAAPHNGFMQKAGGIGRGDNGQLLRVTVTLNGKLQPGVRVQVSVADGSVVVSGLTAKNGTYIAPLDEGVYTVTATTLKASATSPVTIVKSTDPALISLALTPTH